MTENQFRWRTLTAEVADKASPLRQHLDERFPNRRPFQYEYKASAGGMLVELGSAHPGTLGAVFDFAVRFALDPGYKADIAVIGFMFDGLQELVGEVVTVAKAAQAFSPRSPELMRACWALPCVPRCSGSASCPVHRSPTLLRRTDSRPPRFSTSPIKTWSTN